MFSPFAILDLIFSMMAFDCGLYSDFLDACFVCDFCYNFSFCHRDKGLKVNVLIQPRKVDIFRISDNNSLEFFFSPVVINGKG